MNKLLISCLSVCSLSFSQTGMMTGAGDSGWGVWLNANVLNIEYDDADPTYALSVSYMMDNGLELGLNYHLEMGLGDIDWNPIDIKAFYHMKNDNGLSWAFGATIFNVTEADGEDYWYYYETESSTIIGAGGYTADKLSFQLAADTEDIGETLSFAVGKMFDLGGFNLGVSYSANTDAISEGWIGLSLGSTF